MDTCTLASDDNAASLPPWVLKLQTDFATLQSAVEAYMGVAQSCSSPALVDLTAPTKAPIKKLAVHRVKGVCLKATRPSP
eukprot:9586966-Prorocentrum_lima.AAC.1